MLHGPESDYYGPAWGDVAGKKIPEGIWDARAHGGMDEGLWQRYRFDLFGLLSSLTSGEAKGILTSMLEDGSEENVCGFKALWLFRKRWNVQTFSTKLFAFLKVVNPPKIKGELEIVGALGRWEAEVLALERRFGERLSPGIRTAIVLSMLPKELQDLSLIHI